jgi:hypothetical protein
MKKHNRSNSAHAQTFTYSAVAVAVLGLAQMAHAQTAPADSGELVVKLNNSIIRQFIEKISLPSNLLHSIVSNNVLFIDDFECVILSCGFLASKDDL